VGGRVQTPFTDTQIRVESQMPWGGTTKLIIEKAKNSHYLEKFTVALRIPGWCRKWKAEVNGEEVTDLPRNGYLYLERKWKDQDEIRLECSMQVERNYASPMVKYDIGKTAVSRGPFIYCLEEADNGKGLTRISLPSDSLFEMTEGNLETGELDLKAEGMQMLAEGWEACLYRTKRPTKYEKKHLRFIPYYLWNNRGEGEMTVWVQETACDRAKE